MLNKYYYSIVYPLIDRYDTAVFFKLSESLGYNMQIQIEAVTVLQILKLT